MIFELIGVLYLNEQGDEYCELHGPVHVLSALDALGDHWIFLLKQYEIPLNLLFDILLDLAFFFLCILIEIKC